MDGTYRAMRISSRAVDELESNLPVLATIGSISPISVCSGTPYGDHGAFIALGPGCGEATLQMVAPGIAESADRHPQWVCCRYPGGYLQPAPTRVERLENAYAPSLDRVHAY